MYLVIFRGYQMKARTEREVKAWFKKYRKHYVFDWRKLRKFGETQSTFDNVIIERVRNEKIEEHENLNNYAYKKTLIFKPLMDDL